MPRLVSIVVVLVLVTSEGVAQDLATALSPDELQAVSSAVDRGLLWLSHQQNADGSFSGVQEQKEGPLLVPTSYAVMAFLSRGHQPGQGRYGHQLKRAIDFILSTQRPDGSLSTRSPDQIPFINEHPLAGLTLSEAYPFTSGEQKIAAAIQKALESSRRFQVTPKLYPEYRGGWHYADRRGPHTNNSSIETTSWELMFLRSAHNAGFEVPASQQ